MKELGSLFSPHHCSEIQIKTSQEEGTFIHHQSTFAIGKSALWNETEQILSFYVTFKKHLRNSISFLEYCEGV